MFQLRLFRRETFDYKEIFSKHISELRSLQSRDKLLTTALASLADIFAVRSAVVLLRDYYDKREGDFVVRSNLGAAPSYMTIDSDSPLLHWFADHDTLLGLEEVTDQRVIKEYVALKAVEIVPLQIDGKLIGLIGVGSPPGRRHFTKAEKELLEIFGFEVSIAVQNSFLYEQVVRQNTKLKELSRLKNNFIANMTHELATPLHNIIGLAQALSEGGDGAVNPDQQQHLKMIQGAGEQLLTIHQAIFDLSLLESSPERLTIKKLNIKKMIDELLPGFYKETERKETVVANEIDDSVPGIYGDEEKIRQIFEKLLENAARHTVKGEIRLQALRSGDMMKFVIADTGTGIDPAHHHDIFEPFFQVDSGLTRQSGRTGLGLAVVKKIIELHGGRLWLESKLGEGSQFYFTLPLRPSGIKALEIGT